MARPAPFSRASVYTGRDRLFNLPNLLTLSRLVMAPFVIRAIIEGRHGRALALLLLAALTDVLDGGIARRMKLASQTGAYLDPIADKCLMSGVYVAMAVAHIVPWWFVGLVLGRDIGILAAAGLLMLTTKRRLFPPSIWGKASTFVQILTATVWVVRNVAPGGTLDVAAWGLLWASAALTAWSGLHYAWVTARTLVGTRTDLMA
jgi:cardiolipin synthase (CMP-forming)